MSPVERLVFDPTADAAEWTHLHDTTTHDQESNGDVEDEVADESEFDDLDEHELVADAETPKTGYGHDEPTD